MKKTREAYIDSCEISSLEVFTLGGVPQKVLLEGKRKQLPVVICLHGGPGSPVPFSVGCRGLFPQLTDGAVMVYWDQLGCGANNYPIDNTFTIGSFTQMTVELIREIKKRFPGNKVYLFGMSWGSILAAEAAEKAADEIDGVFVYGQVLKELLMSEEVFETLEHSAAPEKVKRRAREIAREGFCSDYGRLGKNLRALTGYIRKYTDGYTNRTGNKEGKIKTGDIVKGLLTSPDYKLKDFIAIVRNGYAKNESLWSELLALDLSETLSKAKVPYRIFQGDTDIVTSTKALLSFVGKCGNENLSVRIIEHAGHFPSQKAMDAIFGEFAKLARENKAEREKQ